MDEQPHRSHRQEFERFANRQQPGLLAEFLEFLAHNKKWWIMPIVLVLLALAVFIVIGGSAAAPFIYTLF